MMTMTIPSGVGLFLAHLRIRSAASAHPVLASDLRRGHRDRERSTGQRTVGSHARVSKIEAGRMDLELTDFDLPTAIENALTLVRHRAAPRNLPLHTPLDPNLAH